MRKLAKLASPLNWRHAKNSKIPIYYLFTDQDRLADPTPLLSKLPKGAALVLRNSHDKTLESFAQRMIPLAHAKGLKVIIAGNIRLALKLGADGLHLSEQNCRLGPLRITSKKPGFIVTCAAHSAQALWHAHRLRADVAMISPIFPTESHPNSPALGLLRALNLMKKHNMRTVALGGITAKNAKRLKSKTVYGLAAIQAWQT